MRINLHAPEHSRKDRGQEVTITSTDVQISLHIVLLHTGEATVPDVIVWTMPGVVSRGNFR
jgi:hypothetical protein